MDTLTGKTRVRAQRLGWFNRKTVLVLQVHVTWEDGPSDSEGMPTFLAGKGWRDAQVEDLAPLERLPVYRAQNPRGTQ